jgi:putative transposase
MPGRDYSAVGAYFITVCTEGRIELFGEIIDGEMQLNDVGNVVAESWRWLSSQYHHATLDEWRVMPDHLHGILVLTDGTGGRHATTAVARPSTGGDDNGAGTVRKPVGRLVGAFKTVSTKRLNLLRNTPGAVVWQRSFWDHVVRDEADLDRIRRYIRENAAVSL